MTALFEALVDDAGLFPPEELAMPDALARYRRDRSAGNPVLTGRFLCPAGSLGALITSLSDADDVRVGLIVPLSPEGVEDAVAAIDAEPRLRLASVEGVVATHLDEAIASLQGIAVPRYVEIPARASAAELDHLAEAGNGAKVRCGGVRAELFPPAEDLAGFIVACAQRRMPVKATAGLHHAVRYRDPATGSTHHGFLNLVLAACRAVAGQGEGPVTEVLLNDDAEALVAEAISVDEKVARAARAILVCYGSCSTSEPIEDLDALGLLGTGVR